MFVYSNILYMKKKTLFLLWVYTLWITSALLYNKKNPRDIQSELKSAEKNEISKLQVLFGNFIQIHKNLFDDVTGKIFTQEQKKYFSSQKEKWSDIFDEYKKSSDVIFKKYSQKWKAYFDEWLEKLQEVYETTLDTVEEFGKEAPDKIEEVKKQISKQFDTIKNSLKELGEKK